MLTGFGLTPLEARTLGEGVLHRRKGDVRVSPFCAPAPFSGGNVHSSFMQVNVGPFDIEAASDAAHGIFQEQKVSLLLRVGRFKDFLKFVFGWDPSLLVVFRERGNLCCWIDGYEAFLDSMVKYGLCGEKTGALRANADQWKLV